MRLTEQSRYSLRVLAHCAERHPALVKVAAIATATGITEQNIFKLIKVLTKGGFVETIRRPQGGVRLAMAPSAIRVGQVIRAIEPRFGLRPARRDALRGAGVGRWSANSTAPSGAASRRSWKRSTRTSIAGLVKPTASAA